MSTQEQPGPEVHEAPAATRRRPGMRRLAGAVLAIVTIVAVFAFLLPRIANYHDVWQVVSDLSTGELATLAVATVINLATYAPPWMAALPGLGYWQATVLTQTSTAISIAVPGGDAVGLAVSYGMLRSWRYRSAAIAVAVLVTATWNQLVNVTLPMIALVLLLLTGGSSPFLLTAGLIGIGVVVTLAVLLVLALRSDRQAEWLGDHAERVANWALRLIRRPRREGWGAASVRFRNETVELISRRWLVLTGAAFLGHLTVFGVLLVSLRTTGVTAAEVSWVEAMAAWGLVRLLTAIPITPGGVGIVELGLASALVGFGAGNAEAVAAVLLYRVLTVVPTLVLGAIFGLTWRRHRAPEPAT
jgi:putative heme transporter